MLKSGTRRALNLNNFCSHKTPVCMCTTWKAMCTTERLPPHMISVIRVLTSEWVVSVLLDRWWSSGGKLEWDSAIRIGSRGSPGSGTMLVSRCKPNVKGSKSANGFITNHYGGRYIIHPYMYISIMYMLICMLSLVHSRLIIGLCYCMLKQFSMKPFHTMLII